MFRFSGLSLCTISKQHRIPREEGGGGEVEILLINVIKLSRNFFRSLDTYLVISLLYRLVLVVVGKDYFLWFKMRLKMRRRDSVTVKISPPDDICFDPEDLGCKVFSWKFLILDHQGIDLSSLKFDHKITSLVCSFGRIEILFTIIESFLEILFLMQISVTLSLLSVNLVLTYSC